MFEMKYVNQKLKESYNMSSNNIIFESVDDFQHVIEKLTFLAKEGQFVFRGYSKRDELLPSLIRENRKFVDFERELLEKFERYGSHYFHATTPIDFMSYAQHFGLPTRLLDFTYNPFIALSFALNMQKSGNYKEESDKFYYYISYTSLDENICWASMSLKDDFYNNKYTRSDSLAVKACQSIESITNLFGNNNFKQVHMLENGNKGGLDELEKEFEKVKNHKILFIDPNQSNQRIIMQQGLFMFPYTLDENQHIDIINRNTNLIKIHKNLRSDLLKYLDTLGFSTYRLMPDIASVCSAIRRKVLVERNDKISNEK